MNIVADFHNFFFNLFYGSSENLWIALMKLRLYSLGLYVKHREWTANRVNPLSPHLRLLNVFGYSACGLF